MTESSPKLRLFVAEPLAEGAKLLLNDRQAHYLTNVMRARLGDSVALFNGRDGEWLSTIDGLGRGKTVLSLQKQMRPQQNEPDMWLVFSPIKGHRLDNIIEKATELGASRLLPVHTLHTIVHRINTERMKAQAIEAAEQCERISIPECDSLRSLPDLLADWPQDRILIHLDESGHGRPIAQMLADVPQGTKLALLVGPEGGFAPVEIEALSQLPFVRAAGLGPRILRADTAAIAGLVCTLSACGDWTMAPRMTAA